MPTAKTCAVLVVFLLGQCALAQSSSSKVTERVQTGSDIWVQPNEKTGDATCLGCSIHVRGEVTGDAVAVGGRVVVEQGGAIDGDVATIAGSVQAENGASIGGDVAAIGGTVRRSPQATIGGDVTSLGMIWPLLIALIPLAILAALITLIVWLVQRVRRRPALPAAA